MSENGERRRKRKWDQPGDAAAPAAAAPVAAPAAVMPILAGGIAFPAMAGAILPGAAPAAAPGVSSALAAAQAFAASLRAPGMPAMVAPAFTAPPTIGLAAPTLPSSVAGGFDTTADVNARAQRSAALAAAKLTQEMVSIQSPAGPLPDPSFWTLPRCCFVTTALLTTHTLFRSA